MKKMLAFSRGCSGSTTMINNCRRHGHYVPTILKTISPSSRRGVSSLSSSSQVPTHLIFGANTDVGKTVISAGLVQSSALSASEASSSASNAISTKTVHYIKPLQCGGSDESFVESHLMTSSSTTTTPSDVAASVVVKTHTLFSWDTPASPHIASRIEEYPVSDSEVLDSLSIRLDEISMHNIDGNTSSRDDVDVVVDSIWIETAGGVLSPSSASPQNNGPQHASSSVSTSTSSTLSWGWSTQGDLYVPLAKHRHIPVVLVGDGRLGGISATLSSLESLIIRGYEVSGLIILDTEDFKDNAPAIREYVNR